MIVVSANEPEVLTYEITRALRSDNTRKQKQVQLRRECISVRKILSGENEKLARYGSMSKLKWT